MKISLLPLREQVIVITGASSGIGLVTARQAAHGGARVVLVARNGNDLERAVEHIRVKVAAPSMLLPTSPTPNRWSASLKPQSLNSDASIHGSTTPQSRCTDGSWTWCRRPTGRSGRRVCGRAQVGSTAASGVTGSACSRRWPRPHLRAQE
jgi:hypothetical protein